MSRIYGSTSINSAELPVFRFIEREQGRNSITYSSTVTIHEAILWILKLASGKPGKFSMDGDVSHAELILFRYRRLHRNLFYISSSSSQRQL